MTKGSLSWISLIPLFMSVEVIHGETEVCGIFKHAQEWTAKESPYLVTGNIVVSSSAILRIGPGVVVKFLRHPKPCTEEKKILTEAEKEEEKKKKVAEKKIGLTQDFAENNLLSITIEGGFYCLGEPGQPVVFRPQLDSLVVGWEGIQLKGIDWGKAEIAYTEFHGANRAVRVEDSRFPIHHTLFLENNVGLWLGLRADLVIVHSHFEKNRSAGIRLAKASPSIVNNVFYHNLAHGIWVAEGGFLNIAYNAFFENGEENCFHGPHGILRPVQKNANGDTVDAYFNLVADPVFIGSASDQAQIANDFHLETPAHLVKDPKLAEMEKKSRLKFWKSSSPAQLPFSPRGKGSYVLSRYSKLLHAGYPAKEFHNPDGSDADIGLNGGFSGRLPRSPF